MVVAPPVVGSAEKARNILNLKPQYAGLDKIIKTAWLRHSKGTYFTK